LPIEHKTPNYRPSTHFSPYHFHHVYTAAMGETLADTVRRLRLQRGAILLSPTAMPVAQIAKKTGYGSLQAFSRAFSQAHLVPPSTYRLNTQAVFARSEQAQLCLVQSSNLLQPSALTATIVTLPPVRVVALRHNGKYTSINTSFQRLTAWSVGGGFLENSARMFGMYCGAR
jgi:AraC family transcriptional regulator